MTKKTFTLQEEDIEFIKYFIDQYQQNLKKGKMNDCYHCATAIVLRLQDLLNGFYEG